MANPRIGIPVSLPQGATYDLDLMQFNQSSFPVGPITFSVGTSPRKSTGIQKLCQIYLKCLLTPIGSSLLNPNYGTDFVPAFVGSNRPFATEAQAATYVSGFINQATQQVKVITSGNDPATTLQSVTLQALTVTYDTLNLVIYLLSAAGVEASIAVPHPQLSMVTV